MATNAEKRRQKRKAAKAKKRERRVKTHTQSNDNSVEGAHGTLSDLRRGVSAEGGGVSLQTVALSAVGLFVLVFVVGAMMNC